jgi:hypothetical protein
MGTIFFAILQKILQKENQNILISKKGRERERERERGVLVNNWINF